MLAASRPCCIGGVRKDPRSKPCPRAVRSQETPRIVAQRRSVGGGPAARRFARRRYAAGTARGRELRLACRIELRRLHSLRSAISNHEKPAKRKQHAPIRLR